MVAWVDVLVCMCWVAHAAWAQDVSDYRGMHTSSSASMYVYSGGSKMKKNNNNKKISLSAEK